MEYTTPTQSKIKLHKESRLSLIPKLTELNKISVYRFKAVEKGDYLFMNRSHDPLLANTEVEGVACLACYSMAVQAGLCFNKLMQTPPTAQSHYGKLIESLCPGVIGASLNHSAIFCYKEAPSLPFKHLSVL